MDNSNEKIQVDDIQVQEVAATETVPMKGLQGFKSLFRTASTREGHLTQMHSLGRIFTWFAMGIICLVPIL